MKGRELNAPPREAPRSAFERDTPSRARWGAWCGGSLVQNESSRFSRGTEPLRRESCLSDITSCVRANSIAGGIISEDRRRGQSRFASSSPSPGMADLALARHVHANHVGVQRSIRQMISQSRAAIDPRDENLGARTVAAAGGSEEERKRERLRGRTGVSLPRPTPPYNQPRFHRAVTATSRMACQSLNQ